MPIGPETRLNVIIASTTAASFGAFLLAGTMPSSPGHWPPVLAKNIRAISKDTADVPAPMRAVTTTVVPLIPVPLPVTQSPPQETTVTVQSPTTVQRSAINSSTGPYQAPSETDLRRLRQCESTDNSADNTGNGFYGAYQFDLPTYHGLGYEGLPSDASLATQTAAATSLEEARGWQPWPACSRKLGLIAIRY